VIFISKVLKMREAQLRKYIQKIIKEQAKKEPQETEKLKGGRYKKEIESLKLVPPGELMKRLKAKKASGDSTGQKLASFLGSAAGGVEEMRLVYGKPIRKEDKAGHQGVSIPLNSIKGGAGTIPPRDGRRYIQHTVTAGLESGYLPLPKKEVQIEIFGKGVLVYVAKKKYSWGKGEKKKEEKPKDESHHGVDEELLGEPDLSQEDERQDDETKDEYSVSANVAGVVTPLGTGPDGGKGKKKKNSPRKRAIDANKRAFGGGEIYKPAKKNK